MCVYKKNRDKYSEIDSEKCKKKEKKKYYSLTKKVKNRPEIRKIGRGKKEKRKKYIYLKKCF